MITFKPISNGDVWTGSNWTITDEDKLAEMIARIALGQAGHVRKVLLATKAAIPALVPSAVLGAKKLLTADDPTEPWHRDGWLFQVIAWIASHLQDRAALQAPPHLIHAHKGFDGLALKLNDAGAVELVVICEHKATSSPRGKITSQVWPEFEEIESGQRDNELIAEATTLLERYTNLDIDEAIGKILWERDRSYSVAITVGDKENSDEGRNKLFKGYDQIVDRSDVMFRRAETFYKVPLRHWMSRISEKSISLIDEWALENV